MSDDREGRRAAVDAIAAGPITESDLRALIGFLADPEKRVQRRAAEVLGAAAARGDLARDLLHRALGTAEWRTRWGAAFALSLAGDLHKRLLDTLVDTLGASDGDLRWAAAEIAVRLARGGSQRATARLLELAREGNPNQRKMALYCLRDLEVGAAVSVAEEALDAAECEVRLAALSAFARLAADRAAAARRILAALCSDVDPRFRRAAAAFLGRLGESAPAVIEALRDARESGDASLHKAAEQALHMLRGKSCKS